MPPKQDVRIALTPFFRDEVKRLRLEIQNIAEKSLTVEALLKKLTSIDLYIYVPKEGNKGSVPPGQLDDHDKHPFNAVVTDEKGNQLLSNYKFRDVIAFRNFKFNVVQQQGDIVWVCNFDPIEEEEVILMSLFSKFNDHLIEISKKEIETMVPNILMETIARGTLELRDQNRILSSMIEEVKSDNTNPMLEGVSAFQGNLTNIVERIGILSSSFLGLTRDREDFNNKICDLKALVKRVIDTLPGDVDTAKFEYTIPDGSTVFTDEDKFYYVLSNLFAYGHRRSDKLLLYIDYIQNRTKIVISIIFNNLRLSEKIINSTKSTDLENHIELSTAISYLKTKLGGQVWVESSESKGTTLAIGLPASRNH